MRPDGVPSKKLLVDKVEAVCENKDTQKHIKTFIHTPTLTVGTETCLSEYY